MADKWQLEAVHEQFRLKKVYEEQCPLFTMGGYTDILTMFQAVTNVISYHLRAPSNFIVQCSTEPEIAAEINKFARDIKADRQDQVKCSFIVIVTNQDVKDGLCNIPIFVVEYQNQRLFIDLKCSLYKSWEAFLQSNDLPECEICYPVDGKYSDKLKIDYVKSPASSNRLMIRLFTLNVSIKSFLNFRNEVISAASIAGTFLFKLAKCALECVKILMPIAGKLVPVLIKCVNILARVELLILRFQHGKIGIGDLSKQIFELLGSCHTLVSSEMRELWSEIKLRFGSAYDYLKEQFECGSSTTHRELQGTQITQSSHKVVALAYKTDGEFKDINKKSDMRVQLLVQHNETKFHSTVEKEKNDSTTPVSKDQFVQKILAKSNDNSCMNKRDFGQETCDLVEIIARIIQGTPLEPDVYADTLESLADTVQQSYERNINDYIKHLNAAKQGAGHEINLVAFNAALGIEGDYKEHFWKKTLNEFSKSCSNQLEQIKMNQLKKNKKIMIHRLTQQNDSTINGLFLCESRTDFDYNDILFALQDNIGLHIKEEELVVNETKFNTTIRNKDYMIFVYQNDQTVYKGLMMIQRLVGL